MLDLGRGTLYNSRRDTPFVFRNRGKSKQHNDGVHWILRKLNDPRFIRTQHFSIRLYLDCRNADRQTDYRPSSRSVKQFHAFIPNFPLYQF